MAVKNVSTKKRAKKNWVSIYAPDVFNKAFLGESYVYGKEDLIGKPLNLNLATFSNDMKKQNMNILFKVANVHEGKGQAEIMGLVLSQSYIKRLVRRGKNKVEDSFLAKTSDGKTIRVKPVIITNARTHQSVISKLRLEARTLVKRILKKSTLDQFIKDLTDLKIQKELKEKLQKVYPLRYFDIRQVSTEKDRGLVEEVLDEEPEKEAQEDLDDDLEGMEESEDVEDETSEEDSEEDLDEELDDEESDSESTEEDDEEAKEASDEESEPSKETKSKK